MNCLLLQGPIGFFYRDLQRELTLRGLDCQRVIYNGGDWAYSGRENIINFTGVLSEWPEFLSLLLEEQRIDCVIAFGDCRDYHQIAYGLCKSKSIRFYVLEEGYIRPNHVTLEVDGANANSTLTLKDVEAWKIRKWPNPKQVPGGFYRLILNAIFYYIFSYLGQFYFKGYSHHRLSDPYYEGFVWHRSYIRKQIYRIKQRPIWKKIEGKKYFVVALQVAFDMQISHHSDFDSVQSFIETVMRSFTQFSAVDDLLVLKHHPLDRGYVHYGKFIEKLGKELGVSNRIYYVHDLSLPRLLDSAAGLVTINSTSAMSAYHHDCPVKMLGRAFYDMPGLSSSCDLNEFWAQPEPVNKNLYLKFRNLLFHTSQVNGSYYGDSKNTAKRVVDKLLLLQSESS